MGDIFEILEKLGSGNKQQFLDVIRYCDARVTADEGIPAIIALDDLTTEVTGAFAPPKADRDLGLLMAVNALLYADLFENKADKDARYPAICPAMSAVAETCFRAEYKTDTDFDLVPYSDVVGAFCKKADEK